MKIPRIPPVGHLIAYEYLWASKKDQEDGSKAYPVAVVLARQDIGPTPVAYVAAISHSPPRPDQRAIEVPKKLKRWLGLDDDPSWLYTDEVNIFAWPGPDLRPAEWLSTNPQAVDTCVIAELPRDWFEQVKEHVAESYRMGRVRLRRRTS